jgi:hypothetical protein
LDQHLWVDCHARCCASSDDSLSGVEQADNGLTLSAEQVAVDQPNATRLFPNKKQLCPVLHNRFDCATACTLECATFDDRFTNAEDVCCSFL